MKASRLKRNDDSLDQIFHALSDRTRRAMLRRLEQGPLGIAELGRPFDMTLPAISKHVRVLEAAGLVEREKRGREHFCTMQSAPLADAARWVHERRQFWDETLDALAEFAEGKS
jgi:DNA-binding transcriptional ArsR family regulator